MTAAYDIEDYGALIIFTYVRITTDDDLRACIGKLAAAYSREPRLAVIIDPSRAPHLPTSQRSTAGEWLAANDAMLRRKCVGTAFVFTSPVSRFVLSSIFLISRPSYPCSICMTRAKALDQVSTWLCGAGINPAPLVWQANRAGERDSIERLSPGRR